MNHYAGAPNTSDGGTEREKMRTVLDAQKDALEMVVANAPLGDVLHFLAKVVEQLSEGEAVASILLLDEHRRLRQGASPSLPDDYNHAVDGIVADVNVGTCSAAAATGRVVITPDIAADIKWDGLATLPLTLGLQAAWSMPILARDGRVLGTFGTYFRERREPSPFEQQLVGILARTAALAIERKNTDEKVKQGEERMQAIFESSPDGILVEEAETIVYVNDSYVRLFGYDRAEEVVGKNISVVISPQDTKRLKSFGRLRVQGLSAPSQYEFKGKCKDGRLIDVEASVSISVAANHQYTTTIIRDITYRKRAEEALRSSEQQLRLITDAVPLLVSFVDSQMRYRFVNRAYAEWFELPHRDVKGMHLAEVLGRSAFETLLPDIERALRGEEVRFERPVPYRTGERFINVHYIPQRDANSGKVSGFHAFVSDVSASKAAEHALHRSRMELEDRVIERTRELEISNKERVSILQQLVAAQENERGRFARDLHDQLGQQMTVLRMKLTSLGKSVGIDNELGRQIDELRQLARQLDAEVDYLAWKFRPAVLDDIGIVAALDQFIRQWSTHFNIPAALNSRRFGNVRLDPEVETNYYRITQEALNNICKHANARNVNVLLEPRDDGTVLIIEDDGVGFEPDEQLATEKGMGLTGMRERAALIGGTLEIESSKGNGTTIYVSVPKVPPIMENGDERN